MSELSSAEATKSMADSSVSVFVASASWFGSIVGGAYVIESDMDMFSLASRMLNGWCGLLAAFWALVDTDLTFCLFCLSSIMSIMSNSKSYQHSTHIFKTSINLKWTKTYHLAKWVPDYLCTSSNICQVTSWQLNRSFCTTMPFTKRNDCFKM